MQIVPSPLALVVKWLLKGTGNQKITGSRPACEIKCVRDF